MAGLGFKEADESGEEDFKIVYWEAFEAQTLL